VINPEALGLVVLISVGKKKKNNNNNNNIGGLLSLLSNCES
jgi:hypothetical protein